METYSIEVDVPDSPPFDNKDNWFESYVGQIIEPVVRSQPINRFWFTRYGAVGHGKRTLFRFETSDVTAALKALRIELSSHGLTIKHEQIYDVAADIGRGEQSRFLGTNSRHQSSKQRGDIVFSFLHATACLMIDCLVGPDAEGRYSLESETQSGFSRETVLEQFHHLFCNMTCVPTFIAIGMPPQSAESMPITYEELKMFSAQSGWRFGTLRKGMF